MNAEHVAERPVQPASPVVQLPGTARKPDARKAPVDLERVEIDYRSNRLTTREIGKLHGRSAAWVVAKAKELGWTRDLTEQARQRAATLLVRPEHAAQDRQPLDDLAGDLDAMARAMAGVRRSHRELIEAQRVQLARLIDEMRTLAEDGETLLAIIRRCNAAVSDTERLKIAEHGIKRILALPSRIYGIKKASDAAKNLIVLERQAFDLDVPDEGKAPPPRDANLSPADVFAWMSQLKPA